MQTATWAADRGTGGGPPAIHVTDIMAVRETAAHLVSEFDGRARAFVQVQQGCDHRCTFCIIPFGRGNSRSVPIGAIVEQVRALVAGGYREIVLRSEEHTSELQSLMRISYAVFCLKKKK